MAKSKIGYINPNAPVVQPPPYRGEWYEDTVPDTLDIAERAALGVNGLTGPTDPDADYEQYFYLQLRHNPPIMTHSSSDWCGIKFWEALPLLRIASGSNQNMQVDPVWMEVILRSIGPDGLFYIPTIGRPWQEPKCETANVVYQAGGVVPVDDAAVTQCAHAYSCGRVLGVMTIYYQRDKNSIWKQICERMIDRLTELATDRGDYCYFPVAAYGPGAKPDPQAEMPLGGGNIDTNARLPQSLSWYYRVAGYQPALTLAKKLVNFLRWHSQLFTPDGRFAAISDFGNGLVGPHFHGHALALLGMLEYAIAADDRELMAWVGKSFEWARSNQASCSLVGFFPEIMAPAYPTAETCEIADIIALALKLSEAGAGDYWDDADRWTRNQFAENQLTRVDWVGKAIADLPYEPIPVSEGADREGWPPPYATTDRVAERNLGAFAGWPTANDWEGGGSIMHCCTGNGERTLYYIWEHMLHFKNGQLKVNLLLNCASEEADVYSHIPYQGRVDIKIKQPCKTVLVRMPEWIPEQEQQVACTVNGKERQCTWDGRYINLGAGNPSDSMTVTFPIQERMAKAIIGWVPYSLTIKGNTVVAIDPPGQNCPLYLREHYRNNETRWRKVKRFISAEDVEW